MMRIYLAALMLLSHQSISTAGATALSSADIRQLLAMVGFNPGTVRFIGVRGKHELMKVHVTGKRGHFVIHLVEREVR